MSEASAPGLDVIGLDLVNMPALRTLPAMSSLS